MKFPKARFPLLGILGLITMAALVAALSLTAPMAQPRVVGCDSSLSPKSMCKIFRGPVI